MSETTEQQIQRLVRERDEAREEVKVRQKWTVDALHSRDVARAQLHQQDARTDELRAAAAPFGDYEDDDETPATVAKQIEYAAADLSRLRDRVEELEAALRECVCPHCHDDSEMDYCDNEFHPRTRKALARVTSRSGEEKKHDWDCWCGICNERGEGRFGIPGFDPYGSDEENKARQAR